MNIQRADWGLSHYVPQLDGASLLKWLEAGRVGVIWVGESVLNGMEITSVWIVEKITFIAKKAWPYLMGPAVAMVTYSVVLLSFDKRYPGRLPQQIGKILSLAAMISTWTLQYWFKKQQAIKTHGAADVILDEMGLSGKKPYYEGCTLSPESFRQLFPLPRRRDKETLTKEGVQGKLDRLKRYFTGVALRLSEKDAAPAILSKRKEVAHSLAVIGLQSVMAEVVQLGDVDLLRDFLAWFNKDKGIQLVLEEGEMDGLKSMARRLAYLLGKNELLGEIPYVDNPLERIADGIVKGDYDQIVEGTNRAVIEGSRLINSSEQPGPLQEYYGFMEETGPLDLVQLATLRGNQAILKRVISSCTPNGYNYQLKNNKGFGLFELAALSGSREVWDYISGLGIELPKVGSQEYLMLLYAAVKGGNTEILDLLIPAIRNQTIIADLYEKAIYLGASAIAEWLANRLKSQELDPLAAQKRLFAAAFGGNDKLYLASYNGLTDLSRFSEHWWNQLWSSALAGMRMNMVIVRHLLGCSPEKEFNISGIDPLEFTALLSQLTPEEQKQLLNRLSPSVVKGLMIPSKCHSSLLQAWFALNESLIYALDRLKTTHTGSGQATYPREILELMACEAVRMRDLKMIALLSEKGLDVKGPMLCETLAALHLPEGTSVLTLSFTTFKYKFVEGVLDTLKALLTPLDKTHIDECLTLLESQHPAGKTFHNRVMASIELRQSGATPAVRATGDGGIDEILTLGEMTKGGGTEELDFVEPSSGGWTSWIPYWGGGGGAAERS